MTSPGPMVLIELALMRDMYHDKRRNLVVIAICLVALVLFWVLIRQQVGISNRQFLRSMIPHHAGAILMCERASIDDSEIENLCKRIRANQQSEIGQMKAKLTALGK